METTQHTPAGADADPARLFHAAADRALDPATPPAERAARITALLKAVDDRRAELAEVRRTDVRELRQTMTLARVGEVIGLSVPRVDQIAKGK